MRYAAVEKLRSEYPVRILCRVLNVSVSGFYAWKNRDHKNNNDERLQAYVASIHKRTRGTYGAVRLHRELLTTGCEVSLWKVKQIRRKLGFTCKLKRRFVQTTDSNHSLAVAPNLLKQTFAAKACNQVWVSDITYIHTEEGWLYLAGIKDIYSREIVGFSMSASIDTELVLGALRMAINRHRPPAGLILHSDRGSQYCSLRYQEKLKAYGIQCSMSRRGNCYDNAPMESFWGLLKNELVYATRFVNRADTVASIHEYIEIFYNRQRIQAALGYLSPAAFMQKIRRGQRLIAA